MLVSREDKPSTEVGVCLVCDRQQEVFLDGGTKIQRKEGRDRVRECMGQGEWKWWQQGVPAQVRT